MSWQPPSLGTAAGYELWSYEVTMLGGTPLVGAATIVETADTTFDIPDGVRVAGTFYVARVIAISSPGYSVTTPFIEPLPDGRASATTGAFSR